MSIECWLMKKFNAFLVVSVDKLNTTWKIADISKYDAIFNIAGIALVDPKP